ncbi:DUF6383 domain-containing protein [uncultured Parabacteroides sp.]|uniref:DUF6383 domain-containing protein n=1 Tax=uncultured Parabacteroides sp. TaxID=512312 RepID=UPI0025E21D45|nr:DUF6383 domain-containing protein [uncultured Parabacteroides sp.]
MNKKIFTVFMAALLMVGALFSNAYAAGAETEQAYTSSKVELKNGVKFYLGTSSNLFPVATVELKDKSKVTTFGTATTLGATTAVFEVCDYSYNTNGDLSTFSLKVKGQYVYAKLSSKVTVAVADQDEAKDITKVFQVTGKVISFDAIYAALPTATALQVGGSNAVAFTATKELDAQDLNEAKRGSFSLKYAADNLAEANIFDQKIVAITLNSAIVAGGAQLDGYTEGTYFAIGVKDADLKAVLKSGTTTNELDNTADAKTFFEKTTFIVLDDTKNFNLDALNGDGEGYKFKTVKGKDLSTDASANGAFVVSEFDCVNNPGEFRMTLKPYVSGSATLDGSTTTVYIGAIKATPTDTKIYITTVAEEKADKLISATFNGTSWVAASTLLKENAMNVVSIYFTSGTPSTSTDYENTEEVTEYHKYLAAGVTSGASGYELLANAADDVDFTSPIAQWVVNGFDGKSKFTLVNRENPATEIELTLATTTTDGVYEIVDAGSTVIANISATINSNSANGLAGKKIKFASLTTTDRDGFLNLASDEMSGIELVFSGANAQVGEKTYYGVFTYDATPALKAYAPSLESAASYFNFEKAKNAEGETDYIMNEVEYAYLDKEGVVVAAKDTMYVASYKLKAADKKYLKADFSGYVAVDGSGVGEFVFRKNINGTYAMLPVSTDYDGTVTYDANIVSVDNTTSPLAFADAAATLYGDNSKFSDVTFAYSNAATSLEAIPVHAILESSLGAISMQKSNKGFMEGILNNNGSDASFTMWLDTANSKAVTPSFYISKGIETKAEAAERLFLYNAIDSMNYWTEGSAIQKPDLNYQLEGSSNPKAIFRAATLISPDTLNTTVDGEAVALVMKDADAKKGQSNGLDKYRFNIVLADEDVDGEYVIRNGSRYLYSLNGKLGFTSSRKEALVITLGEGDATSNEEAPVVSTVKVIAGEGNVMIAGAAGKKVVISNILGQVLANTVISSDNTTIAAPAGIVVVAIEGEAAVKAIVK